MARRAQAFGMNLVVWSEIGVEVGRDGAARRPAAAACVPPRGAGSSAEPVVQRVRHAGRGGRELRHPQRPPGAQRADARPRQRRRVRPAEAGRVLHQHRARRGGRLQGARGGREGEGPARGPRRVRQGAGRRRAATSRPARRRCPASTARTTSARRPTRRRKPSRPRPCASSETFNETGRVPNVVNLARKTPATHVLVVRHQDRPGVLAHVFDCLREAGINVAGNREHRLRRRRGGRRAHQIMEEPSAERGGGHQVAAIARRAAMCTSVGGELSGDD